MKALIVDSASKNAMQNKFDEFVENEELTDLSMMLRESHKDRYADSKAIKNKFYFCFDIRGLVKLVGQGNNFKKYGFENGYVIQNFPNYEDLNVKSALLLFMVGFFLRSSGISNINYLTPDYEKSSLTYPKLLAWAMLYGIKIFFAPLIMIIKSPYTFYKEILKGFLLPGDNELGEIIGYGPYIKFSGHVYFKIRMKMINRVGLFGIMSNDYLGVPLTLHRSPLDGYFSAKLGYRAFMVFSAILMTLAYIWIIIGNSKYELFVLVPFIFISPYFIKTIYIGHLEPLAWGFFCLSIISFIQGHVWLSAFFLGCLVLTHIGIALLNAAIILIFFIYNFLNNITIANFYNISLNLIIYCLIVLSMTIYIIIPFLRSRDKLGRNKLINEYYGWAGRWNVINGLQALSYAGFILAAFLLLPLSPLHFMMMIPLTILTINTNVKWLWSAYTVELSMLAIGSLFIFLNPNYYLIMFYLAIIFTSPALILNGFHGITATNISIRPIRIGQIKKKIIELVSVIPDGARLAFEAGPMDKTRLNYDYDSHLSLLLLDEKFEMMDAYAPEFVDASIFTKIVYHLYRESTKEELEKALKKGGASYLMVYDSKFKDNLRNFGYKEIGTADCTEWTQFGEPGPMITLFKAPFETAIIEPRTGIKTDVNEIVFDAKAGTTYLLRYGYYIGWRAYQNGRIIPIEDVHPGMRLTAPADGPITMRYRFRYYLFR